MNAEVISSEVRKARKPHRCIYCGQGIEAGAQYRHERVRFEGELQHNDWHPECDEAFGEVVRAERGYAEFTPYENERPAVPTPARLCTCGGDSEHAPNCPYRSAPSQEAGK